MAMTMTTLKAMMPCRDEDDNGRCHAAMKTTTPAAMKTTTPAATKTTTPAATKTTTPAATKTMTPPCSNEGDDDDTVQQ
jgi:hypothetical protein